MTLYSHLGELLTGATDPRRELGGVTGEPIRVIGFRPKSLIGTCPTLGPVAQIEYESPPSPAFATRAPPRSHLYFNPLATGPVWTVRVANHPRCKRGRREIVLDVFRDARPFTAIADDAFVIIALPDGCAMRH